MPPSCSSAPGVLVKNAGAWAVSQGLGNWSWRIEGQGVHTLTSTLRDRTAALGGCVGAQEGRRKQEVGRGGGSQDVCASN